jgi:hypothetical protein
MLASMFKLWMNPGRVGDIPDLSYNRFVRVRSLAFESDVQITRSSNDQLSGQQLMGCDGTELKGLIGEEDCC